MKDAVDNYLEQLTRRGVDSEIVASLGAALRGPIVWRPKAVHTGTPAADWGAKHWEGLSGNWTLSLIDFSIAEQPGRKPGDRGQNVGLANHEAGLVLLSDDALQHRLAEWLMLRLLTGAGKTAMSFVTGPAPNKPGTSL